MISDRNYILNLRINEQFQTLNKAGISGFFADNFCPCDNIHFLLCFCVCLSNTTNLKVTQKQLLKVIIKAVSKQSS